MKILIYICLCLFCLNLGAQLRAPYYGEGYDYFSNESPVPTDPEKLRSNVAKWKKFRETHPIMTMSENQLRAVVPKQTGSYKPGCVNCLMNGLGRGEITKAGRWFWPYSFNPLKPNEGTCGKCKMKFPNSKYPTNKKKIFYGPTGIKSTHYYWEHPESKKPYFINVEIQAKGWQWMEDALKELIKAYNDTGDELYSYKAWVLMNEVAIKFPAYVYGSDNNKYLKSYRKVNKDGSMGELVSQKHTDTRISYRAPSEKMGGGALRKAFETFSNTKGVKFLSKKIGINVQQHYIENVLFLTDKALKKDDPTLASGKWRQGHPGEPSVKMGHMFGKAEYFRFYIHCQELSGYKEFTFDGGYLEGPGYACLALNPRTNMRRLNGYTDPSNFKVPSGEIRYNNWEFPWGKYYADGEYEEFWRKAYGIWRDISLPDGSPVTFNDSNHDSHGPSADYMDRYTPLKESKPVLAPGMKHVVLGDGKRNDQFQIQMGFGRRIAHGHADTLGIQLYGMGHYLLDDLSYPKHILRAEYSQSWAHNTVTVDKKGQSGSRGGDVIFYAPRFNGLSAVRVDAPEAYSDRCSTYARTLVSVTTDIKKPYVLDVFRVKGGKLHDYMLYSSSFLMPNQANISLTGMKKLAKERPLMAEGKKYKVPKDYSSSRHGSGMGDPYGIFTDVSIGKADKNFTLDYQPQNIWTSVSDPEEDKKGSLYIHPDKPQVGSKHHVVGGSELKAIMAKICKKPKPENLKGDLPVMILRSEPVNGETTFIVVHEPYLSKGHITGVKQVSSVDGTIAVEVSMKGRKDTIIMSAGNSPTEHEVNGIKTNGILAAVSEEEGKEKQGWLVQGTYLEVDGIELKKDKTSYEGTIVKSFRKIDGDKFHAFEISGVDLPAEGEEFRGSSLIVTNRYAGQWKDFSDEEKKTYRKTFTDLVGKNISLTKKRVPRDQPKDSRTGRLLPYPIPKEEYNQLTAGVNFALEIHSIKKIEGKTYVILKNDHGMIIDETSLRELFQPHRMLDQKTKWQINTIASTLLIKQKTNNAPIDLQDKVLSELPPEAKVGLVHTTKKNTKDLQPLSSQALSSYDFFRIDTDKVHTFTGFFKVPADGHYTFHFRPGNKGKLLIGGKEIIAKRDYRVYGTIVPRKVTVKLKKGFVPILFEMTNGHMGSGFSFEGPGIPRTKFTKNDFYFTPNLMQVSK